MTASSSGSATDVEAGTLEMLTWLAILLAALVIKTLYRIWKQEINSISTESTMDWEQFKAQTIHLNRSRTEEERVQIFKDSALLSWKSYLANSQYRGPRRVYQVESLAQIAARKIQFQLYFKAYVELLLYVTDGNGIYPKKWDQQAQRLRAKVIEIRRYTEKDILDWIHENYHE